MWIQLTSHQQISVRGEPRQYHPGDWVEVGKQQAHLWLSRGQARLPEIEQSELVQDGAGVLVKNGQYDAGKASLEVYGKRLDIDESDAPKLHWAHTVIWDTSATVQAAMFAIGLNLLTTWDIAVPLWDYKILALNIGSDEEREATKAIIRDLRVPVYDTRLVFAKRTPDTERLFELWADGEGEPRLSFLRALYQAKPLILALPCNWTGHSVNG